MSEKIICICCYGKNILEDVFVMETNGFQTPYIPNGFILDKIENNIAYLYGEHNNQTLKSELIKKVYVVYYNSKRITEYDGLFGSFLAQAPYIGTYKFSNGNGYLPFSKEIDEVIKLFKENGIDVEI